MATPLIDLISQVINQPDTRAAFADAPEAFLVEHGYSELDVADVEEVMYILADGSPPAEAAGFVSAGHSIAELDIDPHDALGGAAAALGAAVAVFVPTPPDLDLDPSELDGLDVPGEADESRLLERDDVDADADDDVADDDVADDSDSDDLDPDDLDPILSDLADLSDTDAVSFDTDAFDTLATRDTGDTLDTVDGDEPGVDEWDDLT